MSDAVRDHQCPMCEGDGDDRLCVCEGLGIVDAALAASWADVMAPRPIPPPPERMDAPCADCAFRGDSREQQEPSERAMLLRKVREGRPFYCHQGMHCTQRGVYVPRASDAAGEPIGHPLCAGWLRARERLIRLAARDALNTVAADAVSAPAAEPAEQSAATTPDGARSC